MGIAFNVNENFSISYSESVSTYDAQAHLKSGDTADVDQEIDAIQVAYSMGGMSIKAYTMDVTNPAFDEDAADSTVTEIALGLAF
jgi:outer membrane protein OmpU